MFDFNINLSEPVPNSVIIVSIGFIILSVIVGLLTVLYYKKRLLKK